MRRKRKKRKSLQKKHSFKGYNPTKISPVELPLKAFFDGEGFCLLFRASLVADAAHKLPNDTLSIQCDLNILATTNSNVFYDGSSSPPKRLKSLETDLKALRRSARFSDFEIVCGGETLQVHKAILASR